MSVHVGATSFISIFIGLTHGIYNEAIKITHKWQVGCNYACLPLGSYGKFFTLHPYSPRYFHISTHRCRSVLCRQHVTQRAHKPQLCKSWAISAERGGGNKCWVQLQTDCVCPVGCIFRPEQMLVYHVCCDVIASLFVSWADPHSPSNVKGSQVKCERGGGTRIGAGDEGDGYHRTHEAK